MTRIIYSVLIFSLSLPSTLLSQEFELGVYSPVYADPSYTYEFLENSEFKYTYYGHLGETTRGKGHYLISNDSLYFYFDQLALNKDLMSSYSMELEKRKNQERINISISVFDKRDTSKLGFSFINLSQTDAKGSKIFHTNKDGDFNMSLPKPIEDNILTISFMGHRSIKINLDTITSGSAKINAFLLPADEFVIDESRSKYRFQNVNDTTFILTGNDNMATRFLKRR